MIDDLLIQYHQTNSITTIREGDFLVYVVRTMEGKRYECKDLETLEKLVKMIEEISYWEIEQ